MSGENSILVNEIEIPEKRELLKAADVILGRDVMSKREFLVFGRKALEQVVDDDAPGDLDVIYVELDQETDELEYLVAAVKVLRGQHDYEP